MRGIMRSFGEILASLREERGIYQKELAAILKVSVGTISNYENNIHFPDQEALIQLAEYFDVTIDYLLGRTPYRYNPEVLRQECVPGTTVSDVVEVIQHFNPKHGFSAGFCGSAAIKRKSRIFLPGRLCQ